MRPDQGEKFTGIAFQQLCKANGIQQDLTARYPPHQDGTAERPRLRSLVNETRCMAMVVAAGDTFSAQVCTWRIDGQTRAKQRGDPPQTLWRGKISSPVVPAEISGRKACLHNTRLPHRENSREDTFKSDCAARQSHRLPRKILLPTMVMLDGEGVLQGGRLEQRRFPRTAAQRRRRA